MRTKRLAWVLLPVLCLAFLWVVPTGAQEGREEVFAAVDRAQSQLEQLLIDLDDPRVSQEQLYSEAETTLALLLSVQEQLQALLGEGWNEVRSLAESLYFQAEKGAVEEAKVTGQSLHEELTRIKQTVSTWEEQGASLLIKDYGAYPDDEVSIPILLEEVPPVGVSRFDLELGFLPEVAEATSVTFPRGSGKYEIDNERGRVLISASGVGLTAGAPAEQTLAEVKFTVRGKAKEVCLFSFRRVEVYGAGGERVPSTGSNGSLRVLAPVDFHEGPGKEVRSNWVMPLILSIAGVAVAGALILIGARLVLTRR